MHTPGPWTIRQDFNPVTDGGPLAHTSRYRQNATIRIQLEDGTGIADIWPLPDEGCGDANARLIAAAPKLLEALEKILAEVRGRGGKGPSSAASTTFIREQALFAISETEGE